MAERRRTQREKRETPRQKQKKKTTPQHQKKKENKKRKHTDRNISTKYLLYLSTHTS